MGYAVFSLLVFSIVLRVLSVSHMFGKRAGEGRRTSAGFTLAIIYSAQQAHNPNAITTTYWFSKYRTAHTVLYHTHTNSCTHTDSNSCAYHFISRCVLTPRDLFGYHGASSGTNRAVYSGEESWNRSLRKGTDRQGLSFRRGSKKGINVSRSLRQKLGLHAVSRASGLLT